MERLVARRARRRLRRRLHRPRLSARHLRRRGRARALRRLGGARRQALHLAPEGLQLDERRLRERSDDRAAQPRRDRRDPARRREPSGARVQISHLIFVGRQTWPSCADGARAASTPPAPRGLDVAFDAFPYTAGNTTASVIFPAARAAAPRRGAARPRRAREPRGASPTFAFEALGFGLPDIQIMRANAPALNQYDGLRITEAAARAGMEPFDFYAASCSRATARRACSSTPTAATAARKRRCAPCSRIPLCTDRDRHLRHPRRPPEPRQLRHLPARAQHLRQGRACSRSRRRCAR